MSEDVLYCAVHPETETSLRCNKCGRPMCTRCAVRTPVGYRCRECVYQQQNIYFTTDSRDYVIAGAVAFGMSAAAGAIFLAINYLIVTLFLAAPVGGLISEGVARAIKKRRGRQTWLVVGLATTLGALPAFVLIVWPRWAPVFAWAAEMGAPLGEVLSQLGFDLLGVVLYVVLTAGIAMARFRYW